MCGSCSWGVVTAPSLSEVKEIMDDALSSMVSPERSREMDSGMLMGIFWSEIFSVSMIL